jgi:hypothetical protein
MKSLILASMLTTVLSLLSLSAFAKNPIVTCKSQNKIQGWCPSTQTLPKGFENFKSGQKFVAYVNMFCENDTRPRSYALSCTLE